MRIISIDLVDPYDPDGPDGPEEYVYDLETEAGTFLAGTMESGIIVKNTDSCFVDFKMIVRMNFSSEQEFIEAHFNQGIECAKHCTRMFKQPIKLEFEKVMYPLILLSRKRYASKIWKKPNKPVDEHLYRGVQVVRKDVCDFVKNNLRDCFGFILESTNITESRDYVTRVVRRAVQELLDGTADLKELVLSKQLKSSYKVSDDGEADDSDDEDHEHRDTVEKGAEGGKKPKVDAHWTDPRIKLAHVRLAQQLALRDAFSHPRPPDRVPYVFYDTGSQSGSQCDRVTSPSDIIEGRAKLDGYYYLTSQFVNPFKSLLEVIGLDSSIYNDIAQEFMNKKKKQNSITRYASSSSSAAKSKDSGLPGAPEVKEMILNKPDKKKKTKAPAGDITRYLVKNQAHEEQEQKQNPREQKQKQNPGD